MPCETEKKKTPKTLARICTPHTENAFLVSRKDGYSMHASGCPMTGKLTCWISTWEFVKVITSIIWLPWQPHNTHSGFNESPRPTDRGSWVDACSHGSHLPEPHSSPGSSSSASEPGRAGAPEGLQRHVPSSPPLSHEPSSGVWLRVVKTLVLEKKPKVSPHFFKWQLAFGDGRQA